MSEQEVLVLCGEPYPVRYGFIEHVFAERFAELGLGTSWVMPTQDAGYLGLRTWRDRPLRLVPDRRRFSPDGRASLGAYARSIGSAAGELADARPPHAVLVRNDPVMIGIGLRFARRHGIPLVVQLSHLIEETRIAYARRGLYGARVVNMALGIGTRFVRNRMLARSNLIFTISDAMADVLEGQGLDRAAMATLPEGVDTSDAPSRHDAEARRIARRYGLEDGRTLVYVGNMSRFRELDFLFRVLAEARSRVGDLRLLMVGSSPDPGDMPWLEQRAEACGVADAVVFTGHVERAHVPAYVRAATLGVSPFPPNEVLSTNSPIKLLEYLASERPAIGTDIPEQATVLRSSGGGYAVPHEVGAWVEAVETHLGLPVAQAEAMARAGRAWVASHRDYRILALRAAEAMRGVMEPGHDREGVGA